MWGMQFLCLMVSVAQIRKYTCFFFWHLAFLLGLHNMGKLQNLVCPRRMFGKLLRKRPSYLKKRGTNPLLSLTRIHLNIICSMLQQSKGHNFQHLISSPYLYSLPRWFYQDKSNTCSFNITDHCWCPLSALLTVLVSTKT